MKQRRTFRTRAQLSAVHVLIALVLLWSFPQSTDAYSFLTHEDLVDVAWKGSIRPALVARFPDATAAQLHAARGYAYGGTTIQDMGYYPFGHQLFSNLTHYVRAGEFVNNLIRDSRTVNEYAFALGALSHYVGDNDGHRYATNLSTPIEFPSLGKKYGPIVTYDQAPHPHVRTEFAYDIEQLSLHRFAPAGYMHVVGFKVPRKLVEQAFFQTYGLPLRSVLGRPRPAFESYDTSVAKLLPTFAHAEVLIHHNDFPPEEDTPAFHQFSTRQSQAGVDNDWARFSHKAGFQIHFIAFLIRIVPKIGPDFESGDSRSERRNKPLVHRERESRCGRLRADAWRVGKRSNTSTRFTRSRPGYGQPGASRLLPADRQDLRGFAEQVDRRVQPPGSRRAARECSGILRRPRCADYDQEECRGMEAGADPS